MHLFCFVSIRSEVGRILDTIFNNNHDSNSSSLLSTGGDDFVILDTPSHSSQSAIQSSTSTSSSSDASNYTFSEARETQEATTASPHKESTSKIDRDSSVTERPIPETCAGSSSKTSQNEYSTSSPSVDNNATKTVSAMIMTMMLCNLSLNRSIKLKFLLKKKFRKNYHLKKRIDNSKMHDCAKCAWTMMWRWFFYHVVILVNIFLDCLCCFSKSYKSITNRFNVFVHSFFFFFHLQ